MRIEKRMRSGVLIILAYLLAVMVGYGAGGDGAAQPEVIIKTGGSVTTAVPSFGNRHLSRVSYGPV